jgi:GNAT acetyltransferase-like protein
VILSYHWYAAWREVFGASIRNGVIAVRRGSTLVAVLPIMIGGVRRSPSMAVRHDYMPGDDQFLTVRPRFRLIPVRQLSPVLALEATTWRGGPLIDPIEENEAYEVLLRFVRGHIGWDLAVFPLAEDMARKVQQTCRAIGFPARVDRLDRPMYQRTDLPSWQTFLRSKNSHFRKRYDEAIRRADRAGLTYRTFAGHGAIEQGLVAVADVAERSWKSAGREGQAVLVPYTLSSRRFFETLCLRTSAVVPVVSAIYQDAVPKAVLLSVAYRTRLVTLLTFYDPSLKQVSFGRLLIKMAHEWGVEHGLKEIDFNSNNPFASIYADGHDVYHNLTLFGGSLYGGLIHAISRSWKPTANSVTALPDGVTGSCQETAP